MPVWHARTREMVAAGELVVIGIIQEQHPERCQLFAQWKDLDFPILWDPFNLTGTGVVPGVIAVDEHGVVRSNRPRAETFEDEFLFVEFPAPDVAEPSAIEAACAYPERHEATSVIANLMRGVELDAGVDALDALAYENPSDPRLAFRAGVAHRLRYDSPLSRPKDFQQALDLWGQALAANPDQYIWRRRIQQYGPRMDKPYPFYSWVETALSELVGRGETPVALPVALTPAELARPRDQVLSGDGAEPDPEGAIRRDDAGLVTIETASAFDTSGKRPVASVHVAFRPAVAQDVHWTHAVGPPLAVWIDAPEGWKVARRLLQVPQRAAADPSSELANLTFEVELPAQTSHGEIEGYALYYVCSGADGVCTYLRQDFVISITRP